MQKPLWDVVASKHGGTAAAVPHSYFLSRRAFWGSARRDPFPARRLCPAALSDDQQQRYGANNDAERGGSHDERRSTAVRVCAAGLRRLRARLRGLCAGLCGPRWLINRRRSLRRRCGLPAAHPRDAVLRRHVIGDLHLGDGLNDVAVRAARLEPVHDGGRLRRPAQHRQQPRRLGIFVELIFERAVHRRPGQNDAAVRA